MEAISDDFYNEIHLRFLIHELDRTKLSRVAYLRLLKKTVFSTFIEELYHEKINYADSLLKIATISFG